jgi:hypothetical protein
MSTVALILTALREVLGTVDPWLAAMWLATTIVLAIVLVYGWQRLVQR